MKIIDKINAAIEAGKPCHSFEYFPPKTAPGLENLYARIERMGRLAPAFVDITWGAGGSTADLTLEIAGNIQNLLGLETMMHLTCTNMEQGHVGKVLDQCAELGLENILALRGDPPRGASRWSAVDGGFCHAIDLVRFIRERFGDRFGIAVAGFPEGHDESENPKRDLEHLKEKVDAGADFIITQLFYDGDVFLRYVDSCRAAGIDCPILPGLMPLHNYRSFRELSSRYCRNVPGELSEAIEPVKNNDAAVRDIGTDWLTAMSQRLIDEGAPGLHYYTLNLELAVMRILEGLDLTPGRVERSLPWRSTAQVERSNEDVRPIFWANRPRSYLARTMGWDEFPNGRWGDSRSPAFGALSDYHLHHLQTVPKDRNKTWGGSLRSLDDVYQVFVDFCRGSIPAIPWYDRPLELESEAIRDQLVQLNTAGLLTINSQPRVDGAPSEDPAFGWGDQGGVVYQKAYLELFVSADRLPTLIDVFERHPRLTYHAINREGEQRSNCDSVTAVTWGVFPGREILQPTVVDPRSFEVWKDEAFALWLDMWAEIYPPDSESRRLLQRVHDTFYLVNVVDNDFQQGDLFAVFSELLSELEERQLDSRAS